MESSNKKVVLNDSNIYYGEINIEGLGDNSLLCNTSNSFITLDTKDYSLGISNDGETLYIASSQKTIKEETLVSLSNAFRNVYDYVSIYDNKDFYGWHLHRLGKIVSVNSSLIPISELQLSWVDYCVYNDNEISFYVHDEKNGQLYKVAVNNSDPLNSKIEEVGLEYKYKNITAKDSIIVVDPVDISQSPLSIFYTLNHDTFILNTDAHTVNFYRSVILKDKDLQVIINLTNPESSTPGSLLMKGIKFLTNNEYSKLL